MFMYMRKRQIHIFLDNFEYANLVECAEISNQSMSQVIRDLIHAHSNSYKRKQRLLLARLKGRHTRQEWEEVVKAYRYRCAFCDKKSYQKDHIIPLYLGGSDKAENLRPLCNTCNIGRRDDGQEDFEKAVLGVLPDPISLS